MSREDFSGFGFAAGDVRGTRAWKVDRLGRLTGVTHPQVWRPGENVAECKRTRAVPRPVQVPDSLETVCSCGDRSCNRYSRAFQRGHEPTYQPNYLTMRSYASFFGAEQTEPHPCEGMDPSCACGFYGYQEGSNDYYKPKREQTGSLSSLFGSAAAPVGGVVRGYGKTVLGTRGFRAEKAEILALFVDTSELTDIALKLRITRNYAGIPLFTDYEQMLTEFPPTPPEGFGDPTADDFWTRSLS